MKFTLQEKYWDKRASLSKISFISFDNDLDINLKWEIRSIEYKRQKLWWEGKSYRL